jgi:hypothetical protein
MSPIERLCITAEPMGLPSPEALQHEACLPDYGLWFGFGPWMDGKAW